MKINSELIFQFFIKKVKIKVICSIQHYITEYNHFPITLFSINGNMIIISHTFYDIFKSRYITMNVYKFLDNKHILSHSL
jgi:hypothetical protein